MILFLLCLLHYCLVSAIEDSELLRWLNLIFGPAVLNTFTDTSTLELAINTTIAKVNHHPELGIMGFSCFNYKDGALIAKSQREGGEQDLQLIPFLVDEKGNKICFVSNIEKLINYKFSKDTLFHTFFQETLKIHDSTTNFIFDEYYQADLFPNYLLVARYRQEFFHETQGEEGKQSNDYYLNLLKHLQSYELNGYDTFFWTSNTTQQYFQNTAEPKRSNSKFLIDYSRHLGWRDTYDYLQRQINDHPDAQDPCLFNIIPINLEIFPGKVIIKMTMFQNIMSNKRLIRSCLGYIASTLSQDPAVHHISMRMSASLMNFRARSIQQTAQVGSSSSYAPYTFAGLQGDGQIITIADTGVDPFSCYFYDPQGQVPPSNVASPSYNLSYRKVVQYNYNGCGETIDAAGGHGTHVSGIATGNQLNADIFSGGIYDGVAPNAKLSISSLGTPDTGLCIPSISQLYGPGYATGSRVHSNSWGSYFTGTGYYTDQDTDTYLYQNQGANIFFANGNAGNNGNGLQTVTMEASSKNVIGVGSSQTTLGSQNISYVAFYSSKGPTYDNRFKPDIVSPGDGLLSACSAGTGQQSCTTIEMTGTSMASPSAAGAAALIRQYFIDPNSQFWRAVCNPSYPSCHSITPSGALVKGALIHSGVDMTMFAGGGSKNVQLGASPDVTQGFGRIAFMNVLPLKGVYQNIDLFVADGINIKENEQLIGAVTVSNSNFPLSATLSWYDPPNVEGVTTHALINNLDLTVISPSEQKFYPNGLSAPDVINNVERVRVSHPQTGNWQVIIQSSALPVSGNQLFSLIITSGGTVSSQLEHRPIYNS